MYWEVGAKNAHTDVTFEAPPLSVSGNTGFARWRVHSSAASSCYVASRRVLCGYSGKPPTIIG
jgi:hypothetical protein